MKLKTATYNILILRTAMFTSMGVAYSMDLIDLSTETVAELVLTIVSGFMLGATICIFLRKLEKKLFKYLVFAWFSITLTYFILAPIGAENLLKLLLCFGLGTLGTISFNLMKSRYLLVLSAAAVGSGMVAIGVGSFANNFPPLFRVSNLDIEELYGVTGIYAVYVIGFILLSIVGFMVQWRLFKDELSYEAYEDKGERNNQGRTLF